MYLSDSRGVRADSSPPAQAASLFTTQRVSDNTPLSGAAPAGSPTVPSTVCSVVKTRPGTQGTRQAPAAEVTAYLPWQFLSEFLDGSSTWTATASAHTMVEFVGMQGLHALGSACILTKRPPPQSPNHHRFALESGMETREVCEQMHAACPVRLPPLCKDAPPSPATALSLSF